MKHFSNLVNENIMFGLPIYVVLLFWLSLGAFIFLLASYEEYKNRSVKVPENGIVEESPNFIWEPVLQESEFVTDEHIIFFDDTTKELGLGQTDYILHTATDGTTYAEPVKTVKQVYDQLWPCPHCKSENVNVFTDSNGKYICTCLNCNLIWER